MDYGRFHGRNISLINSSLSLIYWATLAGTVTDAAAESVYEPAISVTHGDYSGRTVNLSPRLTPDLGKFGGCRTADTVQQPQFAPPQRRIDARREQSPRGAMARLRQGSLLGVNYIDRPATTILAGSVGMISVSFI